MSRRPHSSPGSAAPPVTAGVIVRDQDHRLLDADSAALHIVGLTRDQLQVVASSHPMPLSMRHADGTPGDAHDVRALLGFVPTRAPESRLLGLVRGGSTHWVFVTPRRLTVSGMGVELLVTSLIEVAVAPPAASALSVLYRAPVRSVDEALRRGVSGSVLLTICMHCKDIRNDSGGWPLEEFFTTRSSILFSHGLCPACETPALVAPRPEPRRTAAPRLLARGDARRRA